MLVLYLVLDVGMLFFEPVLSLHVHQLRLPPEQLVLLVDQLEQLHYEVLGLDNNDRDSLGPEAEDKIMQLNEMVNQKNERLRRKTELM